MKPIIKELMLKPVKEYFLMTVGMIMYSFAWIGCILPAKGVGGGAAGLSLVLCHAVEEWLGVIHHRLELRREDRLLRRGDLAGDELLAVGAAGG